MNEHRLGWSDYEIVLRIARAGSLSAAARQSGTSHPTLFRRINAIEDKLGVRLFDRFRTGYRLTAAGEEIVTAAQAIEELANDTERRVAGRDLRPSGLVRLATTDTLFAGVLAEEIAQLKRTQPAITIDVTLSNETSDLALREADLAIRPADAPDDRLVGRRLGRIRQAVYMARQETVDPSLQRLSDLPWVGPGTTMPYDQLHRWMKDNGCDESPVCRVDSVLGMKTAVRTGLGAAVLPCYLAERDDGLQRIGEEIEDLAVDLWLLTHPDLRHTARVRAVLDHFGQRLGALL